MRVRSEVSSSKFQAPSVEGKMQDVYELAARWGVAIEYGRWPLATVGEYQARAAKIAVNEAALEVAPDRELAARAIIAHELGHVAARRDGVAREDEEAWAHNFAAQLLGGSNLLAELEAVWRRANDRTFPRY